MPKQEAVVEQGEVTQEEITLLQGFRDLVAERWGYWVGRKLTQQDMNEKTETERKVVREARKAITGDNLVELITKGDIEAYKTALAEIEKEKKVLSKAQAPFRKKIKPLAKAVRFMDNVAIPDALKELGSPVHERYTLSKFIESALAEAKKN